MFRSRPILLVAFAFAVMGDPVSSVAYAIEAALRALHGDLGLLVPTMALVLGVIVLVSLNYHQLYARFPEGRGDDYRVRGCCCRDLGSRFPCTCWLRLSTAYPGEPSSLWPRRRVARVPGRDGARHRG